MSKKSERKRKSVQQNKEKTQAQKLQRPNWAKEFITWKKNRPQQIINMAKEMGYLKKDK